MLNALHKVPAVDPLVVTDEADNNGVPVVAFVSDVSDGNTCPETITRTYSVTDPCGNQILVTQIITVNDITPPQLRIQQELPYNVSHKFLHQTF